MLEPGRWQAVTSLTVTTSRHSYDARGVLKPADSYRKIEAATFLQYGLTSDVTLILHPVTRDVALSGQDWATAGHGLGSLEAGARWRLFEINGETVSFQATTRVAGKNDPLLPYENRPRTELRFGYGTPAIINGKPGFVDASLAWAKRHEAAADEVKLEVTYGWWRTRDRLLLLQYFNTSYPGSGFRRDPWQHKVQTSSVYKLGENWSVQLGSFFTRGGRSTRNERGTVMSLWRSF